jgi:hypothetical protein
MNAHQNPEHDDDLRQLVDLYRRHTPPEPSALAWQRVCRAVQHATCPVRPTRTWRSLVVVAAVVLFAIGTYALWPSAPNAEAPQARVILPIDDAHPEPFAVAASHEIHILAIDVADADRVLLGRAVLGSLEFASAGEIEIVDVLPDPIEGTLPIMQPHTRMPLIVASGQEP